jgi:hypothetical protein
LQRLFVNNQETAEVTAAKAAEAAAGSGAARVGEAAGVGAGLGVSAGAGAEQPTRDAASKATRRSMLERARFNSYLTWAQPAPAGLHAAERPFAG